jgi:SAM-dependent methyltransferase
MNPIDERVKQFYQSKIEAHGPTPQGLDYRNQERQHLCFEQLSRVWRIPAEAASLNDYGCGYGALLPYLLERGYQITEYVGFDITEGMIQEAQALFAGQPQYRFSTRREDLPTADYTIAGGVFNIKLETPDDQWRDYILEQIRFLWSISRKGISFNILTSYSDADKMRPDLYYADPGFFFDYCKRQFSRHVALLHDYEAYEFTILVRR